jgi:hypothetical protein
VGRLAQDPWVDTLIEHAAAQQLDWYAHAADVAILHLLPDK